MVIPCTFPTVHLSVLNTHDEGKICLFHWKDQEGHFLPFHRRGNITGDKHNGKCHTIIAQSSDCGHFYLLCGFSFQYPCHHSSSNTNILSPSIRTYSGWPATFIHYARQLTVVHWCALTASGLTQWRDSLTLLRGTWTLILLRCPHIIVIPLLGKFLTNVVMILSSSASETSLYRPVVIPSSFILLQRVVLDIIKTSAISSQVKGTSRKNSTWIQKMEFNSYCSPLAHS